MKQSQFKIKRKTLFVFNSVASLQCNMFTDPTILTLTKVTTGYLDNHLVK